MTWRWYELRYLALTPLHIGYHTFGLVQRTRTYIPGRALWGALVNCLALARSSSPAPPDYQKAAAWIEQHVRFTYFFPQLEGNTLLPWFNLSTPGLGFGYRGGASPTHVMSAAEFEKCFIQVHGQTAVSPEANTATEGSLHETEFMACEVFSPWSRRVHRVVYQGYLGIENNAALALPELWSAWSALSVGGDRSSGSGRLRLAPPPRLLTSGETFFSLPDTASSDPNAISWPKEIPMPAHVALAGLEAAGDLEPLVGRLTEPTQDSTGFGQVLSPAAQCWTPGSVLLRAGFTFTINTFGLWYLNPSETT
jgi:hypothetical protein